MRKLKSILFLLLLAGINCERQEDVTPVDCNHATINPSGLYQPSDFQEVTYNQNHCGYLPLGKRNYWVYLDSIFDAAGQFQSTITDTLRFKKTYSTPDGITWWDPVQAPTSVGVGFRSRMYTTDSITYTVASMRGGIQPIKWFYAIAPDSTNEDCHYADYSTNCIAKRINGSITVPAGSFSGCMYFSKTYVYGGYDIDCNFKPGVGLLRSRFYTNNQSPPHLTIVARTSTLLNYHIE